MKDISVILINYNSSSFTIQCILSILEKTTKHLNYEIIVVDNASNLDDFKALEDFVLEKDFEHLKLVRSKINTGFGGGNMYGVQFANATHYAFVNNDTVLQNDCLQIVYDFLEKNKDAAICCPQQYNEHEEVQKSFDHFLSLRRELFGRKILEKINPVTYPKRKKIYTSPIKVQSVPGSFLVVSADAFDKVGGFDTNIFLYYEETDLCYRIYKQIKHGNCYLVPKGKYTHFKGKSTGSSFLMKKELKISLLYVLKKNSGFIPYQILRWWLTIKFLFKSIIKPKNFKLLALFLKGAPLTESLKHQQSIAKQ
ncbi:glycosyltransferase family 2 protein [Aquimarina sp. RZ0]|uniref:glycosyltransferase family 2 protein n=1 Tax=Aquimarina sp. RZ0 TaxID=2607730 RepID=UPI0011F169D8|nr:glycosyltransferase family 2 protein [Aquimarina sp. RZ0]KAA1247845.1 glycosyltransferase family 2 protein [Aquimarina sp. RZ0]